MLDPTERASEVVFGLIMALSFTGTIEVATAGADEVRPILVGAVGCNVAWGIVDAVMFLAQRLVDRGRARALVRGLAGATSSGEARGALADALPPAIAGAMSDGEIDRLRAEAARRSAADDVPRVALGARDFRASLGVFALVFLATFPVVLPFLLVSDLGLAKRVSNAVALVLLFGAGWVFGKEAGGHPWLAGLVSAGIGAVLVATTLALGG